MYWRSVPTRQLYSRIDLLAAVHRYVSIQPKKHRAILQQSGPVSTSSICILSHGTFFNALRNHIEEVLPGANAREALHLPTPKQAEVMQTVLPLPEEVITHQQHNDHIAIIATELIITAENIRRELGAYAVVVKAVAAVSPQPIHLPLVAVI